MDEGNVMITEDEKLIIKNTDTKLGLKKIFEELTTAMIEYYEKNYLTKDQLKFDIHDAWMLTMMRAREIDEKIIKEECLNQDNIILEKIENINNATSDPADKEKITALEKEIKELNETIEIIQKQKWNAKKENFEIKVMNQELSEKVNAPGAVKNSRGAGRKKTITEKQIAMIQMMRAQGKTLQEIQKETLISYGNIQKYCKLITDNNKKRAGS